MEKSASVLGALDAHKLPSQAQTNAWIDWAIRQVDHVTVNVSQASASARLSSQGEKLAKDAKDLLRAYRDLGEHKNSDDELQNAIWNLSKGQLNIKEDSQNYANATKNEAVSDAQQLSSALQNILIIFWDHIIVAGGLGDLASLARNVMADTAEVIEQQAGSAKVQLRETEDQVQRGERDALGRERTSDDDEGARDPKRRFESGMDTAKGAGSQAIGAGQSAKQGVDKIGEKSARRLEDVLDLVLERAQNDPAYRDSVSTVFDLASKWFNKSVDAVDTTSVDDFVHDPTGRIPAALSSLHTLTQRLAGGKSTQDLARALRAAAVDVREDEDLRAFFDDLNEFVRRTVHEPTYARSEEHGERRTQLRERWAQLQNGDNRRKWHDDLEKLEREAREYLERIQEDSDVRKLRDAYTVLGKDTAEAGATLSKAANGNASWLWLDFIDVVLPKALDGLKQLPIPRTEYKDSDVEFVIEDLDISSLRVLPGRAHVRNTTDVAMSKHSPAADTQTKVTSHTQVHFKGVQFTAKDVSFWYKDRTMKPISEVSGLLGITVPEQGIDVDIKLGLVPQPSKKTADSSQHAFFTIDNVKVTLNNPTFTLSRTNHPILLTAFKPMFRSRLEHSIETSLAQQITAAIHFTDGVAYDVHRRAGVFRDAGMAPSAAYTSAVWSELGHLRELPGPFSGLRTTSVGVVRDDSRTDVKFAVGAQPQIIPGEKHGPEVPGADAQTKRDQAVRLAEETRGRKDEAGDRTANGVASFKEEVLIKKEKEGRSEGWKSTAFDAPSR